MTALAVDRAADALAVALQDRGTRAGDHVAIQLQNTPQYVLALLALWRLGATALVLNPMYRTDELRRLVDDASAVGIICTDRDVAENLETLYGSSVAWMVSTSPRDFQSRDDERVFAGAGRSEIAPDGDLRSLVERYDGRSPAVSPATVGPDSVALLTYTSSTTGPPKGAMSTHANVLNVASSFGTWIGLEHGDVVFALAPLFHITGAVATAVLALIHDASLVFANRFHPEVTLDALAEHGVTFTIGSITAFNAMSAVPHATAQHFASLSTIYSGGAPIPPATVERFETRFGAYIHNAYGMTETSSAVIAVPPGTRAPVHEPSGTLSIGLPLPNVTARVVGPSGDPLPSGVEGELELAGPQVSPGYWNKPRATATMPAGRLRTGDGAIIDENGWIYLVDRLKDQINTSGYKVSPREVEDVLYTHPAVHEAAVVGLPDEYRGERAVAFVSLRSGGRVTSEELIAFARERLAAYKAPREVHVLDSLPKTESGKIRRRQLRDAH
jgi:long-chain acyl-CoA synthetase